MTLREAGRRIRKTPDYVRGAADTLGIPLTPVGRALVMTEADFRRLQRRIGERTPDHSLVSTSV